MYELHQLGCAALAFVRLKLSKGARLGVTLCDLPLESGDVFAYFPPTVTARKLLHFRWRFHTTEELESGAFDWEYQSKLHNVVADYLEDSQERFAFFHHATFPPGADIKRVPEHIGDNYLRQTVHRERPVRDVTTELYLALRSPSTKEKVITYLDALPRESKTIGVLAKIPSSFPPLQERDAISVDEMQDIASQVDYILVPAYGDDITLIWSRSGWLPTAS